jgi:signal transduction histidine kinase
VYAVVARLCLALDAVGGFATLVWPPSGIAVAVLFATRTRYRLWPGVFLGAFAANVWIGAPPVVALAIAAGNTAEAWVGVRIATRWGVRPSLERMSDVAALLLGAAVAGTLVSAVVGTLALRAGGIVAPERAALTFRAWWIGDALGVLVFTPLLLVWTQEGSRRIVRARLAEALTLGALIVLAGRIVLFETGPAGEGAARYAYALFPLLIWAALRFGLRGATAALAGVSLIAVSATVLDRGPFASGGQLAQRLLALQAFTAVVAVTVLLLAAAVAERARALRVRDRFLAMVSHDLQSPLTAIRLRTNRLARPGADGEARVPSKSDIDAILRSATRLERLARDLSDIAAIEAEKLSVHPTACDLSAIAIEASDLFRASLPPRLTLDVRTPALPVATKCDRERVFQVLSNLIGNAIKFTRDGGTITVEVEQLPDAARVRVADTGVGMQPHEVARVFEPFWQGADTGGRTGGMGLGLFIARHIVTAHAGRIWAESRPEKGATFFFTLPLAEAAAAHDTEEEGRPASQRASVAGV